MFECDPFDEECQDDLLAELRSMGITSERVLAAMKGLYRSDFVPASHRMMFDPYENAPATIGHGQTISQPYIVAYMTQVVDPRPGMRILEIGTGSGYQAALLAKLGAEVYSVERLSELYEHAREVLTPFGVHQRLGDGSQGWPEKAPFDAILVACAAAEMPPALVEQLGEGGTMVIPTGTTQQVLEVVRKREGSLVRDRNLAVTFVPLVEE